jgi:glutaminyl-peptide cyclotransferase
VGSAKLEELRAELERELAADGLAPVRDSFRAETPRGTLEFANLYTDLAAGDGAHAPLVILATHIDTKSGLPFPFVGANDGGSGTAVLLELARVLATRARRVDVRFLFLDGEEAVRREWHDPDNCYGSRHHVAERARNGELARIQALVLLDMVGDRELVLARETASDAALFGRVEAAARAAGLGRHFEGRAQEIRDDHLPFLAAGIPAIDLIDFEYGPDHAWWHSQDDTLDKCSPESLGAAGGIVLAAWDALEEFALERAQRAAAGAKQR